ncbi:DUF5658 family protein [Halobacteriales archaeon Cl-PHB]
MSARASPTTADGCSGTDGSDGVGSTLRAVEQQLWLLVAASLVLDVALTYAGLQRGLTEGNPFMAAAIDAWGFVALALAKVAVLSVAGLVRFLQPRLGPWLSLGIALPWGGAATVNASLLVLA